MNETKELYMSKTPLAGKLTRAELSIIRATEAFSRWSATLHKTVANSHIGYRDVAVLHAIRMCGNAQNLSELLLFLNRNDVSTLQYSLKKLEQEELVDKVTGNSKRETGYQLTPKGEEVTDLYAGIRDEILINLIEEQHNFGPALEAAANVFERLTGIYDQATQTVMNRKIMGKSITQ